MHGISHVETFCMLGVMFLQVERATLAAVRKVLPPKQIDLRQILKNRRDKNSVAKPLETLVNVQVLYTC